MATYDKSAIQSKGGDDKEAKHKDGNTKDVISSHSRVLVQYGSGITGDCDFKSLKEKRHSMAAALIP